MNEEFMLIRNWVKGTHLGCCIENDIDEVQGSETSVGLEWVRKFE